MVMFPTRLSRIICGEPLNAVSTSVCKYVETDEILGPEQLGFLSGEQIPFIAAGVFNRPHCCTITKLAVGQLSAK
jgi:hypothetical protein